MKYYWFYMVFGGCGLGLLYTATSEYYRMEQDCQKIQYLTDSLRVLNDAKYLEIINNYNKIDKQLEILNRNTHEKR